MEEILFRGIILEGLLHRYKPNAAIVFSSLLFSLAHFNPWQGLVTFFAGLFLGWIYTRTRSLVPCMLIHFVNNAQGYLFDITSLYRKMSPGLLISVICVIIYLGCWVLDIKMKQPIDIVVLKDGDNPFI